MHNITLKDLEKVNFKDLSREELINACEALRKIATVQERLISEKECDLIAKNKQLQSYKARVNDTNVVNDPYELQNVEHPTCYNPNGDVQGNGHGYNGDNVAPHNQEGVPWDPSHSSEYINSLAHQYQLSYVNQLQRARLPRNRMTQQLHTGVNSMMAPNQVGAYQMGTNPIEFAQYPGYHRDQQLYFYNQHQHYFSHADDRAHYGDGAVPPQFGFRPQVPRPILDTQETATRSQTPIASDPTPTHIASDPNPTPTLDTVTSDAVVSAKTAADADKDEKGDGGIDKEESEEHEERDVATDSTPMRKDRLNASQKNAKLQSDLRLFFEGKLTTIPAKQREWRLPHEEEEESEEEESEEEPRQQKKQEQKTVCDLPIRKGNDDTGAKRVNVVPPKFKRERHSNEKIDAKCRRRRAVAVSRPFKRNQGMKGFTPRNEEQKVKSGTSALPHPSSINSFALLVSNDGDNDDGENDDCQSGNDDEHAQSPFKVSQSLPEAALLAVPEAALEAVQEAVAEAVPEAVQEAVLEAVPEAVQEAARKKKPKRRHRKGKGKNKNRRVKKDDVTDMDIVDDKVEDVNGKKETEANETSEKESDVIRKRARKQFSALEALHEKQKREREENECTLYILLTIYHACRVLSKSIMALWTEAQLKAVKREHVVVYAFLSQDTNIFSNWQTRTPEDWWCGLFNARITHKTMSHFVASSPLIPDDGDDRDRLLDICSLIEDQIVALEQIKFQRAAHRLARAWGAQETPPETAAFDFEVGEEFWKQSLRMAVHKLGRRKCACTRSHGKTRCNDKVCSHRAKEWLHKPSKRRRKA